MLDNHGDARGQRRAGQRFAGTQGMLDAREKPGISLRRAPDHHRIAAGLFIHAPDVGGGARVAVADHRNADRLLHACDQRPVGFAVVVMSFAGARMHRHRDQTFLFGYARHVYRVGTVRLPKGAHLDAYRQRRRGAHRAEGRAHQFQIAHHRRAGPQPRHLRHAAAHIDIDQLGAIRGDQLRRARQMLRPLPEDLHGHRMLVRVEAHHPLGARIMVNERIAADKLRHHQPRAVPPAQNAKAPVGDPGHRRQHQRRRKSDIRNRTGYRKRHRSAANPRALL